MRFALRFRPIPFVAALVVAIIGILLGNWQQERAAYKTVLQQRQLARAAEQPLELGPALASADALAFRRVRLRGEFVATWPVFLANRPMGTASGFYLAMPFRIAGSDMHVLVLRGWLPRDPREYTRLPAFATPAGLTTIDGVATASAGKVMQLGTPGELKPGAIVQNLTPGAVARASGLRLAPFFVQQTGASTAGEPLVRDWPQPAGGVDKHHGYAFQWYALAAMAVLFFVMTGFRSGRKQVA